MIGFVYVFDCRYIALIAIVLQTLAPMTAIVLWGPLGLAATITEQIYWFLLPVTCKAICFVC